MSRTVRAVVGFIALLVAPLVGYLLKPGPVAEARASCMDAWSVGPIQGLDLTGPLVASVFVLVGVGFLFSIAFSRAR